MRILVTGHNGYIGSAMVPILVGAGHQVVGLDTFYFGDCTFESDSVNVEFIRKDIRDVSEQDLSRFDAIIHLAALCNDPLGNLNPEATYSINHLASVCLARLARGAGVKRFLFASSCSMYGAAGQDDFMAEDAPLHPLTPYAISKVRAEEDLYKLGDRDFSPVLLRNATVYGVSPRLRADVVLNNLVGWAYATGQVRILSDGSPWRPIVHVEDVSRVFALMLDAPREAIHNEAFNVGIDTENYQVRDLAEIVRSSVSGCSVVYSDRPSADQRTYRVDFGKLAKTFPVFKSRLNARLGTGELYSAYERTRFRLEDLEGRRYTRVRQLKYLIDNGALDLTLRWNEIR